MLRLLLLKREDGELSRLLVRLDEDLSRGGVFNRDELTIGGELAISGELALLDDLRGGRSRVCIGVWSCNDATSYQILNIASGVDLHYIMQLQRGKNDSSDGEKVSSSDVDGARRACRS